MTSTPITTADIAKGKIDDALSVREKIGYGLGDAGGTVITCLIMNFLTFFYTEVFGLSPALVGTLFIALRVFDAISDPVMGVIADRTAIRSLRRSGISGFGRLTVDGRSLRSGQRCTRLSTGRRRIVRHCRGDVPVLFFLGS